MNNLSRAITLWPVLFAFVFFSFVPEVMGQFATILNIPPDPNIGNNESIGSDTQVNVFARGGIGDRFKAGTSDGTGTNIEVNISGGFVGLDFDAYGGSVVNISGGQIDESFDARNGSTVNISGGRIGNVFRTRGVVNISGGVIDPSFLARGGSKVNISGGLVREGFQAISGSVVNISDGTIGSGFDAFIGSVLNITGGSIGNRFDATGKVNISGGSIGNDFNTGRTGEVNLIGTQFVLDGIDITASLIPNVPFKVNGRDVTLNGLLVDGSPFSFDLNSTNVLGSSEDYFHPDSTLTVTLIEGILGDFEVDDDVDGSDFLAWQRGESPFPLSSFDLAAWQTKYGTGSATAASSSASVPEPAGIALLLVGFISVKSRRFTRPTFGHSCFRPFFREVSNAEVCESPT